MGSFAQASSLCDGPIGIIGLGLIGGSLAKCLLEDTILGFDTDAGTIEKAMREGVIARGYTDCGRLQECEMVIIALPMKAEIELLKTCTFARDATVMDVCGVKSVMDYVPKELDYVSTHPMAGKEVGGYDNSDAKLFQDANFILVGRNTTSDRAMARARQLGEVMGCGNIFTASREEHDEMVTFTSQLPHVLAACIVSLEQYQHCHGYEGGSLADFTRIAQMDSEMWSDLFLMNRKELVKVIGQLEGHLQQVRLYLEEKDQTSLHTFLSHASKEREGHE